MMKIVKIFKLTKPVPRDVERPLIDAALSAAFPLFPPTSRLEFETSAFAVSYVKVIADVDGPQIPLGWVEFNAESMDQLATHELFFP